MEIKLKNIGINKWELEKIPGMKVQAIVYAKEAMLPQLQKDLSLPQLAEAAMLPGVISPVIGMPDIHEGFGLPIGGVMATAGLISVGAVGMDINCGVRLLTSKLAYDPKVFSPEFLRTLINKIEREIPIGVGGKRRNGLKISLSEVISGGAKYIIDKGYGNKEDLEKIEENGCLAGGRIEAVTPLALKRVEREIGTLGSGNHFIEIQYIKEVYDENLASKFNLLNNKICLMLHSGSRALGHQTCLDYTEIFWNARQKYGIEIPRKGLAALPLQTTEGQHYFAAMAAAVNFAFANRQLMTHFVREVWQEFFPKENKLTLLYDVTHNIAKWEPSVNSKLKAQSSKLLVHRKGATRALPPGHPQNPKIYQETGHPVIIPGSMGTASYVLVGTEQAKETFYSVNHGAGRLMSRGEAFRSISKEDFERQMEKIVYNKPYRTIADEAPEAYKNIEEVVEALVEAGLTKKVARLKPLAVIKGD
jgi:tRNA-splicing ligase RtcB